MASMRRVAVIGSPGAGKSTLARRLGGLLDLPVYHLDRMYWGPGWTATPRSRWRRRHARLLAESHWILDGHYADTLADRLAAADTVFYLCYPRKTCMRRALARAFGPGARPDMAPGCAAGFDRNLLSLLRRIWRFPAQGARHTEDLLESAGTGLCVFRLRSPAHTEALLAALGDGEIPC